MLRPGGLQVDRRAAAVRGAVADTMEVMSAVTL
jgi:hypothetical protein